MSAYDVTCTIVTVPISEAPVEFGCVWFEFIIFSVLSKLAFAKRIKLLVPLQSVQQQLVF